MSRLAPLLLLAVLSGCWSNVKTGDQVVDIVLDRENWFGSCVEMHEQTIIFTDGGGNENPVPLPNIDLLDDPEARSAAKLVAASPTDWGKQSQEAKPQIELLGEPDYPPNCSMKVNEPLYSEDFAFVGFTQGNGQIGIYVLEKSGTRWIVSEKVIYAYW